MCLFPCDSLAERCKQVTLSTLAKHLWMAQVMKWGIILLAALLSAAQPAGAQSWPGTKPLRFEVIGAAGGLVDLAPRELSNYLPASIGVPLVVENRPGANGNIAAGVVAKADPDGHTFLVTSTNQAVNPTLLPNPGFDYGRDLVPVSMVVASKLLLVASPSFPAKDLTDIIKIAKQNPKSVSIATPAVGSPIILRRRCLRNTAMSILSLYPTTSSPRPYRT
jgi:tripartite-type tricarboxylate transporter receptor subunit TctC